MRFPDEDQECSSHQLQDVLEAIHNIVAAFDSEGRLSLLNVSGRLRLGLPLDKELRGWLLSDLLPEDEADRFVDEVLPGAIERGEWSGRTHLKTSSGTPIPVRLRFVAHLRGGEDVRGFTLVAEEESEPRNSHQGDELYAILRILHDISNLIGPILAHAQLAQAELDAASSARRRLGLIEQAAESARHLCQQVSTRRRDPSVWRVVDLAQIARAVVGWLRPEFPHASIDMSSNASVLEVFGDAGELERALVNLCRNAAESLPEGRGSVRVSLGTSGDGRRVRLTVSDDGRGIARDRLATLFESNRSTKGASHGFGLALARDILSGHGGSLEIESAPGVGTRVHVELPLHGSATPTV